MMAAMLDFTMRQVFQPIFIAPLPSGHAFDVRLSAVAPMVKPDAAG
jgi:hypothetical protein